MTYEEILSHFRVEKRSRDSAQCHCPAHKDSKASLTISRGQDGRTLINCFAGCSPEEVCDAVGLKMADLFDGQKQKRKQQNKREIAAEYDYTDLLGRYVFTRRRMIPKYFYYGVKSGGRFKSGLGGRKRKDIAAIYGNLEQIRRAREYGEQICYAEGEKDVDSLAKCGYTVFTCGAAKDWRPECAELFAGADAVIFRDNDRPGLELAERVAADVRAVAKSVRIINPVPDIPKGDISDFLKDHAPEDIRALIEAAPDVIRADSVPAVIEEEHQEEEELQLVRTSAGRVAALFSNYAEIVRKDHLLRGKLSFDTLSGRPVISGVPWDLDAHPVRDHDLHHIREYISINYGIQNNEDVRQAVEMVAESRPYNPVEKVLQSLTWDGKPRIRDLFPRFLGAERSPYTEAVTLTLLHGAIRRALEPGVKFDLCVILADSKQGTGKSTICRFLALRDEFFCDSLGDLADTERAFETIRGRWICELGELLATRRTKDIEATKAYLSRQYDTYRAKYHTFAETYPRRCVFIGTTNNVAYLPGDRTGNRRFIPLPCDGNRQEVHPLEDEAATREYIRQCYAEALERGHRDGWQLVIPREFAEDLERRQEDATPDDTRIPIIQQWLDSAIVDGEPIKAVCTRMIWDCVFHGEPKQQDLRDIAEIMSLKISGWERYHGKDGRSKSGRIKFSGDLILEGYTLHLSKYGAQKAWIRTC